MAEIQSDSAQAHLKFSDFEKKSILFLKQLTLKNINFMKYCMDLKRAN